MGRACSPALAAHLLGPATTVCFILKLVPINPALPSIGISTLDADRVFDDGKGPVTYKAKRGYTAFDTATSADMTVDSSEAAGLLAEYEADGVTAEGIARGEYDNATFVQYLVNYEDLSMGAVEVGSGRVGRVTNINDLTSKIELRSRTQILQQASMIELTSITDRARYGDERNKMPLHWYGATVATAGAEGDRVFSASTIPGFAEAAGSSTVAVTNVPFFTGDGVTRTAQLLDTAGAPVPAGFVVTNLKSGGAVVPSSAYAISTTGLVTWTTAPAVGASLTWDGTLPLRPNGYFAPGVVRWLTGANAGQQNVVEQYDAGTATITLLIPTLAPIVTGDTFEIRRDSDGSKAQAIADNNLPNMRAEPELPRANGISLQAPTPSN